MQKPCVPNTSKQMQAVFYRKSAKKATDFALLREIFCFRDGTPFLASLLAAPEMRFGGQGESAFLTPPRGDCPRGIFYNCPLKRNIHFR